ncbi:50S ribosome-binding GTPase, partial [bacterium]|nr:50S ribosome-binding GTPase [bacterium]
FSFRSYQNGKIDLLKAESIASLIASQTEMGANLSIKNLSGEISKKFNNIRNLAVTLLAEIEARVDFPEDQIPELDKKRISLLYEELISDSEGILSSYSKGRLAFSGIRVTILGKPNAGKSTLLNVLLEEDRAIVSANPGTTRDILEADIVHNGRRIIFYDTAGLRSTKGKVEAEGVKRAKDKAQFSDVVIILVEKKDFYKNQNIIDEFFNFVPRGKRFVVASKSDLFDKDIDLPLNSHVISSKTRFGINSLLDKICEFSNVDIESDFAEGVLTTERQVSLLNEGLVSLRASKGLFEDDAYFEIVSIEIREFINSISDITGEVSNNDIYDKLFSSFCIGK